MFRQFFLFFILIVIFSQCNNELEEALDPNTFTEIEENYGIHVMYEYSERFFPNEWLQPPISAYGHQIDYFEVGRMEPIINDFLSQYSYAFLQVNLHKIHLLKRLYFYDRENHGGGYSKTDIYLIVHAQDYDYLLGKLHHLFSRMLYRNYGPNFFPTKEWSAINDSEFKYGATEAIDLSTEERRTKGLLEQASVYSIESDFNVFVNWIFTKPEKLQEICEKYDKIREKYNLVIQFYDQMNSGVEF
ncbi:MAG: hypothetical protein RLO17_22770 [Cyclobacteriaceae bacterium]